MRTQPQNPVTPEKIRETPMKPVIHSPAHRVAGIAASTTPTMTSNPFAIIARRSGVNRISNLGDAELVQLSSTW